jgi:hypothetical protein
MSLPGSDTIVPITTHDELIEEGRAQHNCAATYAQDIADGAMYIYRVLKPERCTLSIKKGKDGLWSLDQLKLACNASPQQATHQHVEDWMSQSP